MKTKLKITLEEYLYLVRLSKLLSNEVDKKSNIYIELEDDKLIDLHDWVCDKLQTSGFDENYELNKEGAILNSLVDKLNI